MHTTQPVNIFISYARPDAAYRDALIRHLAGLRRSGKVQMWSDNEIAPGVDWDETNRVHLSQADIVALLISDDFMNSDTIWNNELKVSLHRRAQGESVLLLPILIKPCLLENTILDKIQRLPRNQKAISEHANADEAWYLIAKELSAVVDNFSKTIGAAATPSTNQQHASGVQDGTMAGNKNVVSGNTISVGGNMHIGDNYGAPENKFPSTPSSVSQLERQGLEQQLELATRKLQHMRNALILETDAARQFAYRQEVEKLELMVENFKSKLEG